MRGLPGCGAERHRELRAADGEVPIVDLAAVAARHLADQGEADARGRPGAALVVQPRSSTWRGRPRRCSPGPLSPTTMATASVVAVERGPRPGARAVPATASRALSTRLPSTVTRSRGSTCGGRARRASPVTVSSMPRSAASAVLPSSSAATHRVADRADHPVGEQLGDLELLGGEVDRLLGAAHLDEGHHGVQPVGGLVVLRAQRLGEPADHVELAGDRAQLGVVAQGDHGADLAALPACAGAELTTSTWSPAT